MTGAKKARRMEQRNQHRNKNLHGQRQEMWGTWETSPSEAQKSCGKEHLKENLWKVLEGLYRKPANTALILRMDLVEGNLSPEYQLVTSEQRNLLLGSLRNRLTACRSCLITIIFSQPLSSSI